MHDKQMIDQQQNHENRVTAGNSICRLTPAVDIYETTAEVVMLANLPGVEEADLQLEVSRGLLTIEAEVQADENQRQSRYYRQFKLSDQIDADASHGGLKDGILTLRLPKIEEPKPKKISVTTHH